MALSVICIFFIFFLEQKYGAIPAIVVAWTVIAIVDRDLLVIAFFHCYSEGRV